MKITAFLFMFCTTIGVKAQSCLPNIGFEKGDFEGWICSSGRIADGVMSEGQVPGRHMIFSTAYYNLRDPYGGFPLNCPNGSNYTVQLGNNSSGGETESMSYQFTIPKDAKNFSIVYNYAVVFENPEHTDIQQPRFIAKVYDVGNNTYVNCGSFEYTASGTLPDFLLSSRTGNAVGRGGPPASIYYKPWSAVSLDLSEYAGRTLRLEFSTADCTLGGHFGYAYVDVNESCSGAITGNTICPDTKSSLTLYGPAGFREYYWYTGDQSELLDTTADLELYPIPSVGTKFTLRLVPYQGFGCATWLTTEVGKSNEVLKINAPDKIVGCNQVNLSDPRLFEGSTPGLEYRVFADPEFLIPVPNALGIMQDGRYFIRGKSSLGCVISKPVEVKVNQSPILYVSSPPVSCGGAPVDISTSSVVSSDVPVTLSYWLNAEATLPLTNPKAVSKSGTYFIKAISVDGCETLKFVNVIIENYPTVVLNGGKSCKVMDLTTEAVKKGSTQNLFYSYWRDAAATVPLLKPDSVAESGVYYIKGTTRNGCSSVGSIVVEIYNDPAFVVTNPVPVIYPATVSLIACVSGEPGLNYSFFKDAAATQPLLKPDAVGIAATYYIKAENPGGCWQVKPVKVLIHPPENPIVTTVNTFTPNGDGVNDEFKLDITGALRILSFRIYNRWGDFVFETVDINQGWNGTKGDKPIPPGTYYLTFQSVDDYRKRPVNRSGRITLIR